ncbi:hypothetical protein EDD21DRAFT_38981 [Dissophora ornata]|nr:hypothetical protein EDD21DRAFT_38981 [Dissophora ornata]
MERWMEQMTLALSVPLYYIPFLLTLCSAYRHPSCTSPNHVRQTLCRGPVLKISFAISSRSLAVSKIVPSRRTATPAFPEALALSPSRLMQMPRAP